jgi:hypothetical protein
MCLVLKNFGRLILLCSLRAGGFFGIASVGAAACPFCSSAAAAANTAAVHALRDGILVLSIPPMLICAAIALMAVRRRYRYHTDRHRVPSLGEAQVTGRRARDSDADFVGGFPIRNEVAHSGQES